jgi:hypothetical protein
MAFGDSAEEKEWQLIVVDIRQEQALADFRIVGSDCIELETKNEFGMTGFMGEVYLLDVACNLQITTPAGGSTQTSPMTVAWVGAGDGAFNQVFIDGIEVGRTNDNELTIPTIQGEHELEVRSLDEYGRGIYQTVTFSVEKSSSAITQLIIWLAIFLIIALVPVVWGFIIRRQRRKAYRG